MNMPRFTAEASLYKTTQSYRGSRNRTSGDAGSTVVTPQFDICRAKCFLKFGLCPGDPVACVHPRPPPPFCEYACYLELDFCIDACPSGGGVGGSRPCCPPGTVCDGMCIKEPGHGLVCEGECIRPGRPGEE